jgi:Pentapeptide repeats (8 copies)
MEYNLHPRSHRGDMRVRIQRERPEPWLARKQRIRRRWLTPFWAVEWMLEWCAFVLSRWTFLDVLEYLEGFSVLIAVIFYFAESGDRLKQKHYQAWQVINTAQGKGGSGGRIEALEELNSDGVSLVGVDVSGAFLQNIHLKRARLVRASFGAADLRDSDFAFADFSDASLHAANFRQSNLRNASLERANLAGADLASADLSGADLAGATLADADLSNATLSNLRWQHIRSLTNANVFGVKDAPEGFLAWAKQHGAVVTNPGSP